jgi:hypothetical protein
MARRVFKVQQGFKEIPEPVSKAPRAFKDSQDSMDRREFRVRLASKVERVFRGIPGPEFKALQESKAPLVSMDKPAFREIRVFKEIPGPVSRARLGYRA